MAIVTREWPFLFIMWKVPHNIILWHCIVWIKHKLKVGIHIGVTVTVWIFRRLGVNWWRVYRGVGQLDCRITALWTVVRTLFHSYM